MPTLSELRVIARYDGKELKAGAQESIADMERASAAIKGSTERAETAVKASMSKIGAAYAKLPAEARQALDAAANAQAAFADKQNHMVQQVGMGMSLAISAPVALAVKSSLDLAAGFEQNMDVLQVSIGATQAQMAALGKEAQALGADMTLPATSAVDAAQAMRQLAKSGLDVDNTLKAARGTMQLAAATGVDAAEAATIQGRALAEFSLKGDQATHVADLLSKATYSATGTIQDMSYALQSAGAVLAHSGQNIDDTVAAITELAKAGVTGSDAGTSLKQMFLRLEEGGSMRRVRDLLHLYGVEVYDSSGKMKDMRSVIAQFAPMMDMLTEKQRNAALATIFGTDAIRAAQIVLGGGTKAFDEMKNKVTEEGSAASLAAARNKGLAGAIDGMKSAWETLEQQAAEPVLKPMAALVREVGDLIGKFTEMPTGARNAVIGLTLIAAGTGPVLLGLAAIKNAWMTVVGVSAASTAAKAAQAGADAALFTAANLAAQAEGRLAAGEALAGDAALAEVAPTLAAAAAKTALATASTEAALATGAATGAAGLGATALSGLAGAAAFLVTPVGLVTLGVAALAGGLLYANKIVSDAEDAAKAADQAFRDEAKTTYEAARAKVELTRQTVPLINEYIRLEEQRNKNQAAMEREQDLANQIVALQPELAKGYRSTGDAILDMAKAHDIAAAAATNQYEKEMLVLKGHVEVMNRIDAMDRARALKEQGAGMSPEQLKAAGSASRSRMPKGVPASQMYNNIDTTLAPGPILDTMKKYWADVAQGGQHAQDIERELFKVMQSQNQELAKAQQEAGSEQKKAHEDHLKATMSAGEYSKHVAEEERKAHQADWDKEIAENKVRKKWQDEKIAHIKELVRTGKMTKQEAMSLGLVDDVSQLPAKEKKARAAREKDDSTLTDDIIMALARHVSTPAGAASCAFFADAILKGTGVEMNRKGFGGGAQDLVKRVKAAGGFDVPASEAKPGDLVYYSGPGFGAKDPKTGKRSGYHVGVYEGDGYMAASSGEPKFRGDMGPIRPHQHILSGAHFVRPVRGGKWDNTGDIAIDRVTKEDEERKEKEREVLAAQKEIADAYLRTESAIKSLTDADGKYAEMLGIELDKYKALTPEQKKRAVVDFDNRSTATTNKALEGMRRDATANAIIDPTDKALAQFSASLADRKDLNEADKAQLVEEKRKELVMERAEALKKELADAEKERLIITATTEQERIRLQLMLSRPGISPEELDKLSASQYDTFVAGRTKATQEQVQGMNDQAKAAEWQAEAQKVIGAAQLNTKLTETQRYKIIQDQNDELERQVFLLDLEARIKKGDILQADEQALVAAHDLAITKSRMQKDEDQHTQEQIKTQDALQKKIEDRMSKQRDQAREFAQATADVLIKPFEKGLHGGLRGFFKDFVHGWEDTIKQMLLDWAKASLTKSFEPMFKGRDLRKFDADEAAKKKALEEEQKGILRGVPGLSSAQQAAVNSMKVSANNVLLGDGNGGCFGLSDATQKINDKLSTDPTAGAVGAGTGGHMQMDPMMLMMGLAAVAGGGKNSILTKLMGVMGILSGAGVLKLGTLKFAAGGQPPLAQPILTGEYGPELWIPPMGQGRIIPAGQTGADSWSGHGGGNTYLTQNIVTNDANSFKRSSDQVARMGLQGAMRHRSRNFVRR